jgi:recombination protein RecA
MSASPQLQALRALLDEQGFSRALPRQKRAYPPAPTGIGDLDALLGGGLPRGQISEIAGPVSSGCTRLVLSVLAEATQAGEVAAYIDATDCLDPRSAEQAGVVLDRLLWVRCRERKNLGEGHGPRTRHTAPLPDPYPIAPQTPKTGQHYEPLIKQTRVDQTWQAMNLVASAGGFGVIVLDLGGLPRRKLRQWQGYQWLRPRRTIEHGSTVLLVMAGEHLAASASALVLELTRAKTHWSGTPGISLLLDGISTSIRLVRQRRGAMGAGA